MDQMQGIKWLWEAEELSQGHLAKLGHPRSYWPFSDLKAPGWGSCGFSTMCPSISKEPKRPRRHLLNWEPFCKNLDLRPALPPMVVKPHDYKTEACSE